MYSQEDLDAAVRAGALPMQAAEGLRGYVEAQRNVSTVDDEQFRLVTGFNDIFVTIAAAILLFAVAWIGYTIPPHIDANDGPTPAMGLFVAATAWGLAEYFTRRRRMALPSILLLLAFVGGVFAAATAILFTVAGDPVGRNQSTTASILISLAAALAVAAAWLHWRRFHVPITVAAGAGAGAALALSLLVAALGNTMSDFDDFNRLIMPAVLIIGVGVFALAMWWDGSDRERRTRRSDVAFWLHLLAAPMIAHPIFNLLGLTGGDDIGAGAAIGVLAIYVLFGIVALAIDRRALLVSALAYVLYALTQLFRQFGAVELNIALTALVIGSALLLLSAFWHNARAAIVRALPGDLQARLPILGHARVTAN